MSNLIYIEKVPSVYQIEVDKKVREIATKLDINPNWIMIVFKSESEMDKHVRNSIGCVGLIQFCPDRAGGNTKTIQGTTYLLDTVRNMSWSDQIDLCYKYWYPFRNRIESLYDLYLCTFYPLALTKSDSWIFGSQISDAAAKNIVKSNPSIANGAAYITRKVFAKYIDRKVSIAKLNIPTGVDIFSLTSKRLTRNWFPVALAITTIIGVSYYLYKHKKDIKL
jgi:hypothetical protein